MTARAGNVMMALMSFCAVLFVLLAARWVVLNHGWSGLVQLKGLYIPGEFGVKPLLLGAAIASLSYIGFDAISTLAEDTVQPERDISIATVLRSALFKPCYGASDGLYGGAGLAGFPLLSELRNGDSGHRPRGRRAMEMMGFITFILLVACLGSALTGQAGASRLLFGMGRDGVISRRVFAYIDPKYSTPVRGIYVMGAVSLAGSLALRFQLVVELLNFGAFVGFILVNLSVIRHFYLRRKERHGFGLVTSLLFPLAGAGVCTYIWLNLSWKAQLAGFCWLGLGLLYLAVLTRGFRIAPKSLNSLAETN